MAATKSYLPDEMSGVLPNRITQEFWDRCAKQELSFQRCTSCGTFRHEPTPVCWNCRSTEWEYAPVSGRGRLYSYTIVTHALSPLLAPYVPYNVSLIEFDDAPGVRLVSNVIDAAPDELEIGMPVQVEWQTTGAGTTLPRFVRA